MKKVLVNFIQDRSGSMSTVWMETLNGLKAFVKDLKDNVEKDGVEYLFSLTVFDTLIETPVIAKPIGEVDDELLSKHDPRGSTALYDAVGLTMDNTDKNRHGAEKIICVIVTDGQENSSREWSKDAINTAIDKHLNAGDWTFTYLGTQPETWDEASSIGIGVGATAGYQGQMAHGTYTATAHAIRSLSASAERQSKNLFTSKFANSSRMRAAGMTVKPDHTLPTVKPQTPTKSITSTKKSSSRWR